MAADTGGSGRVLLLFVLLMGAVRKAEIHWYEAHGVGRREFKVKFPLLS